MTDYMVAVLGVSQSKAFKTFAIVSLVAPVGGVIAGGIIFDKCGGYNSYKALHVLQCLGLAASLNGIICSRMTSYHGFVPFMFL